MHTDQVKNDVSSKLIQFFKDEEFDQALDQLLSIKNKLSPASFHYNLGVIYINKDNLAAGKLNLAKSKNFGFSKKDLNFEIKKIDAALKLEKVEPNLSDYVYSYSGGANGWEFLLITLVCTALVLLAAYFKKISSKWIVAGLLLISLVPCVSYYTFLKNFNTAIVLESIPFREGPSKIFSPSGQLKAGTEIIVGKSFKKFVEVVSPSAYRGWVTKEQLGFL